MESLTQKIQALMEQNQRVTDGNQYTLPSPELYPFQWLWDSCFHAIILSKFDVAAARAELRSALSRPLRRGMLPHIIYWEEPEDGNGNWGREMRGDIIDVSWGTKGTSSITQPPIVAKAVWMVYEREQDEEFLQSVYFTLKDHFEYLAYERAVQAYAPLLAIVNPDESGEDNSPRFDGALGLPAVQTPDIHLDARIDLMKQYASCGYSVSTCMKKHFAIIDVPFNIIYAEGLEYMARIAGELSLTGEVKKFKTCAKAVKQAIREHLLVGDMFQSINLLNKGHITADTWARFMPLYGGFLSQEEASVLVEDLCDTEQYWPEFPIPTASCAAESFDPVHGFWRGPVWIAPNWFIYHGLKRYGFTDVADTLKQKTIKLLETSGFREQYNPHTGDGIGAKDFTWGGLVLDME